MTSRARSHGISLAGTGRPRAVRTVRDHSSSVSRSRAAASRGADSSAARRSSAGGFCAPARMSASRWPGEEYIGVSSPVLWCIQRRVVGLAVNDQETEAGLTAVGVAVPDPAGALWAALSLAVPTARYSRDRLPEWGAVLLAAAAGVSRHRR